ncbi:hypothetical protein LX97_02181 [Nonlabens dokdonensis]|uniref:Lipoprotein n=2 Tax=Nonlabens dokdonensis TaxID=328515 RepID=L7WC01_NONDD|nr:DUF6624 domain-containing protein [Nonlabens dokdonensis]AGC77629.1 hypothetical protein DDD_2502 [Nonlabens dokdonensis DSW-6]PZX39824.1 hypothetical protein LX97_02181 [Nonlabens dokdonensis]
MKINILSCILIILIITSCKSGDKYKPEGLRKMTHTEQIEMAKAKLSFNYENVVYKKENGSVISKDSLSKYFSDENLTKDIYLNDNDEPKIIVFRKATENDKKFKRNLYAIYNEKIVEPVITIDINCDEMSKILDKVYALDQNMRIDESKYDPSIDQDNLVTVVSLLEKCGMPTLKEINQKQMNAIWFVFQHGDNYHRKKYFHLLKNAAQNGDLKKSKMALMEDRMLMDDGKPQIYGSQMTDDRENGGYKVYDLENPETVDKRRASVGLEPLSEYVKQWDITFDVKQR